MRVKKIKQTRHRKKKYVQLFCEKHFSRRPKKPVMLLDLWRGKSGGWGVGWRKILTRYLLNFEPCDYFTCSITK